MTNNSVPDGHYRIRLAGAKSDIANAISDGKKCHYVQIGIELTKVDSIDDAKEFVKGKGLIADAQSLDYGEKPAEPEEEVVESAGEDAEDEVEEAAAEDDATA